MGRFLRKLLVGWAETAVALVLALAFFLVVLGTLTVSFPRGTGLSNLYDDLVLPADREGELILGGAEDDAPVVAHIESVTRNVRDRSVNALAWTDAREGSAIGDRHAIQTFDRSGAVVAILESGELTLGENSLVVIRRSDRRRSYRSDRAALVLLGGTVKGTVGAVASDEVPLDIVTAGAEAAILPRGDEPAQFEVAVNSDESSTFRMISGETEVRVGDETVVLGPDHALTVIPDEPLGTPHRIRAVPRPLAPEDGMTRIFGEGGTTVDFRWSANDAATDYRLTIARDARLADVVHEENLATTSFRHENLRAGDYYWRVSSDHGGIDSPGPVRRFRLVEDREPPALEVALPETVDGDRLVIRGSTEPGATVMIGTATVRTTDSGEFEYAMALRRGPNVVVIEAVDAAGNVAYRSDYVRARF